YSYCSPSARTPTPLPYTTLFRSGGNNAADFPTLGLDAAGVYLAADLFDANGNPVGSTLLSLPKAGLLLSTPVITNNPAFGSDSRSEEHTSELQSLRHLVCRLLLE